ncbi:Rtn1p [Sugiyamaella lignohabitans]|uniref:Reticulon-like protein n=1 Tax=Sugiyamaella lignohabitans TaxID=796027 RepID=A0A167CWQ2_9ASCO|nr:Rtn1p [Sugiyamaella lignohabitans]ANB12195.1 Rtn1p [Sugiyamaella lignohabitans]
MSGTGPLAPGAATLDHTSSSVPVSTPVAGSTTGAPVTKNSLRSRLPPVLTWENPVRSGTVLAEILGVLIVLRYANLVRLALRFTYIAIGVTGAAEFATRHLYGSSTGFVSSYRPSRFIHLNQASIEKYASCATKAVVHSVNDAKRLLDAEDLSLSLGSFITVFVLYVLTGFLSISTLLIISAVALFAVPPIYLQFQTEIDDLLAHFHKQAHEHYKNAHGQVMNAAGPHLDVAKKHFNNVASAVGINRGGFPVGSTGSKQDIPTKPAEPVDVPGGAAITPSTPIPEKKAPRLSEDASAILKSHEATQNIDSVPTILGNVSLDPHASSTPHHVPPTTTAQDYISEIADNTTQTSSL